MRPVSMKARRGRRERPHLKAQDLGLVGTVGPCAQRRVALNASGHRDALLNDRRESAVRFERPAKQALALATEPRAK